MRTLLIPSANYWFQHAKDESHPLAERLLFMENALNHTEGALRGELCRQCQQPSFHKEQLCPHLDSAGSVTSWGQEAFVTHKETSDEARDAARYRYLRVDDNWGEDAGPDFRGSAWGVLGELSGSEFDEFIDARMKEREDGEETT